MVTSIICKLFAILSYLQVFFSSSHNGILRICACTIKISANDLSCHLIRIFFSNTLYCGGKSRISGVPDFLMLFILGYNCLVPKLLILKLGSVLVLFYGFRSSTYAFGELNYVGM